MLILLRARFWGFDREGGGSLLKLLVGFNGCLFFCSLMSVVRDSLGF